MTWKTYWPDKEITLEQVHFTSQDQVLEDEFEVGFGNAKIYYDNAEMLRNKRNLEDEVGFGNAVIYVPPTLESGPEGADLRGAAKAGCLL